MNKARREKIEKIRETIQALIADVETIRDEEQESYDNMPESFQMGDKGGQVEGNISCLEEVIDQLQQADETLDSAKGETL